MDHSKASLTALFSAFARAYHARHDAPKIFDDFLAQQLFAPEEFAAFERNLADALNFFDPEAAAARPDLRTALAWVMQGIAPITLSRARYAEDLLETSLQQGTRQYVLLGAGLDTFAFRRQELLQRLQVFELDHPATQADKQRRIARAGWSIPKGLHFVPVDFAQGDLPSALRNSSLDPCALTFFGWLGVTYYLAREVVFETLRSLASLAPRGSQVVFDYLDAEAFIPGKAPRRVQLMPVAAERCGEPMQTALDSSSLSAALAGVGLTLREHLAPEQIQARYFAHRRDGYRAFEHVHFAAAAVA
ncbi:MAG: class I SAM-dependent methyltransferase [Acidobacteriia bacterium]|nr:class I SAM-dependent methyltransferase [Terriglobia bacterium]